MFKTLALAALSVATFTQFCDGFGGSVAGFGPGVNRGDLRAVNRLNEIENQKLLRIDNAINRNVGNPYLNNRLKNDLTGIVTQSTNLQTRNILNNNRFGGCY